MGRYDEDDDEEERILIQKSHQEVDPDQVEKLLVKELNELSISTREKVLEEIHGVLPSPNVSSSSHGNLLPLEENDEEERLLELMQAALDELEGHATEEGANAHPGATPSTTQALLQAYQTAKSLQSEWISDRHFRWSFLCREDFQPKNAALRMLRYLNLVSSVYKTDQVLLRPVDLKDLDPRVRDYMHAEGPMQILPVRDPAGRRVFVHLREIGSGIPLDFRHQLGTYMTQCLCEDRDGVVLVYFLHYSNHKFFDMEELRMMNTLMNTTPLKLSAVHLCCPDLPLYDVIKAAVTLHLGRANRVRLRMHKGSYTECKYSLKSFGIGIDRLPINLEVWKWSHDVDMKYFRKWLTMRDAKEATIREAILENQQNSSSNNFDFHNSGGVLEAVHRIRSKFVEHPYHEDCLFGKGSSVMNHPGNVAMRRLMKEKYDRFEQSSSNIQRQELAGEIIEEIHTGGGRFLREDAKTGLFVEVDDDVARKKIMIAFRDSKKKKRQKKEQEQLLLQQLQQQQERPTPIPVVSTPMLPDPSALPSEPKTKEDSPRGTKNKRESDDIDTNSSNQGSIFDVDLYTKHRKTNSFSNCFCVHPSPSPPPPDRKSVV